MHEPPRILVVDDNRDNVDVLKARLEDQGYEVLTAADGKHALALAAIAVPDLILLDIMMPKIDGLEVCRRLKQESALPFMPIILVTAKTDPKDIVAGLDAGGDEYLTKPVDHTALVARVRSMLRIKAMHDTVEEQRSQISERSRELERLSRQDGLTGLANRRYFDDTLRQEFMREARECLPLSLILGDVDHFKDFNDHYGHVEGDACLRRVASVFASACRRPADLAARYGGEELALILPNTTSEAALQIGESLRQAIDRLAIPHAVSATSDRVSVSLGVATATPRHDADPRLLIECADQALYQAKQQGRNRCVVFLDPAYA